VDSGEIGPILSVTGRFGFPHRPAGDFRYSKNLGGGALLDAGFYPLAAAVALLDSPLEVRGSLLQSAGEFEVDTNGAAMLSNLRQTAFLDWGFGRSYRSEIDVWCEDATVTINRAFAKPPDLETALLIRRQSGETDEIRVPAANHFALMMDRFASVTAGIVADDPRCAQDRARLLAAIRDQAASIDAG
ncbi:MAG: gfo/Idh/MocA family oxidoreductase, partial [Acidimicrobiia bacterium]